jgi:hypothetical protein
MLVVRLMNSLNCVLDTQEVHSNEQATKAVLAMIREAGELSSGDKILIEGYEEEEPAHAL